MDDLISRQALLKQIDIDSDGEPGYYGDTWKFIDTIKSMPSAELGTNFAEVGTDCISRQAAIDALKELTANGTNKGMVFGEDAGHRIEMLPPAQPQRTGKWIRNGWAITCSECGYDMPYTVRNFCPNCGAKMTEGDAE